jgi:TetR/AcrR family transcriptional repressor of nem operon
MLTTKQKAVIEAKKLVGLNGYHGFSFQHIADNLGIKKPSLFAHFDSKEDLGLALLSDYKERIRTWSEGIADLEPKAKMMAFFDLFIKLSADGNSYCPIASLSAEMNNLPDSMKENLLEIFQYRIQWLSKTIEEGQKAGNFKKTIKAKVMADFIYCLVIGAQSLGRIQNDSDKMNEIKKQSLAYLLND